MTYRPWICSLLITLAGCGGGSDSTGNAGTGTGTGNTGSTAADLVNCKTGTLADIEKAKALAILNQIRDLHGLAAVTYDTAGDEAVMQASLMFAANAQLSHTPPSSWRCYSSLGAQAAAASNIALGLATSTSLLKSVEDNVIGWVTEVNNVADNVGHRRWLLDPFLKKVAYGRVAGQLDSSRYADGAAIQVIYTNNDTGGSATNALIAYPVNDYPSRFFPKNALLSVSVMTDATSRWANQAIDFGAAKVTVTARGGSAVTISRQAADTAGMGLPNNLQFAAANLQSNTIYDVAVKGVLVNGKATDYSYWFRVVE